jgi:MerR family copper efflux transcriptional regulator
MESRRLRSGELARLAGVSPDTLRHYERVGVLPRPERTAAGYRQYPAGAIERVRLVRGAIAIGFSLAELGRILRVRDAGGAPCREVRAMAKSKLAGLRQQIADLTTLSDVLRKLLRDWGRRLARTPRGKQAALLEALSAFPHAPALTRRKR